jgi:hypothetical protein
MDHWLANGRTRPYIPKLGGVYIGPSQQVLTVRTEGNSKDNSLMPQGSTALPATVRLPASGELVLATGYDRVGIRAKGHRVDFTASVRELPKRLTSRRIPQAGRPIRASC